MKLVREFLGVAALLLLATSAHAQRGGIILPTLQAPVAISPGATTIDYNYPTPNATFVWDQYPAVAGLGVLLPSHFIICLRDELAPACTHANATFNVLPTTPVRSPIRASLSAPPIGYRYSYTPMVPDDRLDHLIEWEVGACTTMADTSCKFTARTRLIIATQDIVATNAGGNVSGAQYLVSGDARNRGWRDSAEFSATLDAFDAVPDSSTGKCLVDPNDERVSGNLAHFVIDKKGVMTRFSELPRENGRFVVSNVVAIFLPDATHRVRSSVIPRIQLPATASQLSPRDSPVGSFPTPIPSTRPWAFATRLTVDSAFHLLEPYENNNAIADCEQVF